MASGGKAYHVPKESTGFPGASAHYLDGESHPHRHPPPLQFLEHVRFAGSSKVCVAELKGQGCWSSSADGQARRVVKGSRLHSSAAECMAPLGLPGRA